ncbi:hypothetical protein Ancab_015451 [Ancistrocladus abbreviatus]
MAPMRMDKSSCKHDGSQQNQLNGHIGNGGSNHDQDRKPADAAGGHARGRADNGAVGGGKRPVVDGPSFYAAGDDFKDSETGKFIKKKGKYKDGSRDEGCSKMDLAFYTAGDDFKDSETGTFIKKKGKHKDGSRDEGCSKVYKSSQECAGSQQNQFTNSSGESHSEHQHQEFNKTDHKRQNHMRNQQSNGHPQHGQTNEITQCNGRSNHGNPQKPAVATGGHLKEHASSSHNHNTAAVGGGNVPGMYEATFYSAGKKPEDKENGTFTKKKKSEER